MNCWAQLTSNRAHPQGSRDVSIIFGILFANFIRVFSQRSKSENQKSISSFVSTHTFSQLLNFIWWTGWFTLFLDCCNGIYGWSMWCLEILIAFMPFCKCGHLFCSLWNNIFTLAGFILILSSSSAKWLLKMPQPLRSVVGLETIFSVLLAQMYIKAVLRVFAIIQPGMNIIMDIMKVMSSRCPLV